MSKFEKDLSQGSVAKQLMLFSMPFLLSNIVQSLYNVADMFIVGNFSGTNALAGVNIGGQVTFILTNIIAGLCAGATIIVAQQKGAKEKKAMGETISTLMALLVIAALVTTVVMLVLKNPFLKLLKTPVEAMKESGDYLLVTVLGMIFIFMYNALSAIMRGLGDSKRPLYFILIACVTNIVLDFVLVAGFKMGAIGAAIATVFSQALSVVLCIVFLKKDGFIFDFKLRSFKLYKGRTKKILRIGLPTAVQNGIVGVSFLFITALVNTIGGVNASAAVGIVGKINSFAILPAVAMSSSIGAMVAQNIGAGAWHRVKKTYKIGTIISVVISFTIFAVVMIFPEQLLRVFDKTNPEMIEAGVQYFRTFALDYLFVPFVFCFNGLFIGAGHTTFSLINGVLSSVALRIPACYLFGMTMSMGLTGVGIGAPVASLGSLLLCIWFYFSKRWQKSNVL